MVAPTLHRLGRVDFEATGVAMRRFTADRALVTPDEIWLCEHPPVYSQGLAGRAAHLLDPRNIPVVQSDRGGQVTYHGPGQVVAYALIDLKRQGIFVKEYVFRIEQAVLRTLEHFGVTGHRIVGAPGIYVKLGDPFGHAALGLTRTDRFEGLGKIAALGIKVSRHCTYHGLALNVEMDLRPFEGINPCGFEGLRTVDLSTIGVRVSTGEAADLLGRALATSLST